MDDWEVIDDSSSSIANSISYLHGIETDSNGIIKSDYFSLDSSHTNYVLDDQISIESDNPSWIDPVSDTTNKPITEIWTTDGSGSDDVSDVVEFEAKSVVESDERKVSFNDDKETETEDLGEEKMMERNRVAVWYKLPLDLLKYCLFKASPVWSLSIAAAMMGVVILGRRLYKMKQKTRTLQLTMDDKVCLLLIFSRVYDECFTRFCSYLMYVYLCCIIIYSCTEGISGYEPCCTTQ